MNAIANTEVENFEAACDELRNIDLSEITAHQIDTLKKLARAADVADVLIAVGGWYAQFSDDKAPHVLFVADKLACERTHVFLIFDADTLTQNVLEQLAQIYDEAATEKFNRDNNIV